MILGPILDHIFGRKKDKLFCPLIVFCKGMSNAICDLVLYLQSEGLNISWKIPFQYLTTVFAIQYSTLSLTGSQFIFLKWDGSIWDLDMRFEVLTQKVPKHKFRILKVFDNFKNKQKSVCSKFFLICRSMYILKVYSCWETWAGRGSEWSRITTIIETLK